MKVEKNIIAKFLQRERKTLEEMVAENKKIKGGNIKERTKGNRKYYTECVDGKEHGITNDTERVQMLLRKQYLKSEIETSRKLIKILEKASKELSLLEKRERILKKGAYDLASWEWMNENFETNTIYPEALKYKTLLGVMVRSKSEANIANTLERLGVPYRYEQQTEIFGHTCYPDFTIRKYDGTLVIWEHNGMMNDEDYANKAAAKTRRYEADGYRQHKNLIITYEDDIRMPEQIEEIVKRFILI